MSDFAVRRAAFDWLAEQSAAHDDVLPWSLLIRGFELHGDRVPLVSMQGIFKPRVCDRPLSIRTAVEGPYDDRAGEDGRFLYAYRGTDPNHHDNVGLRELMRRRDPLIYFFQLLPGRYLAAWPVMVVGDDPRRLMFTIQHEDARLFDGHVEGALVPLSDDIGGDERRQYVTRELQVRLHQRSFRERVLRAYRSRCALCRLRHHELLDAAHIVPDSAGGEPRVTNGLALCKLHHAAFDKRCSENPLRTADPVHRRHAVGCAAYGPPRRPYGPPRRPYGPPRRPCGSPAPPCVRKRTDACARVE